MPFSIVRQDITKLKVDGIVNAANTDLRMGGGVCGAIFKGAGAMELQRACDAIGPIQTGEAVITPGFHLPAKYIIHTAGPIYRDGKHGEAELLRSSYRNALKLAQENHLGSIAFPLLSSGIYGYPKEEALDIATSTIRKFLEDQQEEQELEVILVVFDREAFRISETLMGEVEAYIDENYVDERHDPRRMLDTSEIIDESAKSFALEDYVENLDESFSEALLRIIDGKGKTDVEVYKKANLDRKLFSKIRSRKGYMPSKRTALALAVALELDLGETDELLERAGFALSRSSKFDVILEYFIVNRNYDIFRINEVLFKYDQPLLGS